MRKAPKLSCSERSELQILHAKDYSAREIAIVLGRSPNTIASEIRRNSLGNDDRTPIDKRGMYSAIDAQHKAYTRRKYAQYQGKKIQEDDELRSYIITGLQAGWNPDEISGAMKREQKPFYASKTAIYAWLYSAWGQHYCQYLSSRQYTPKKRKANKKTKRLMIPDRTSIHNRPKTIEDREQAGHWEFDSVVSSKQSGSTAALAVVQERTSRLLQAEQVSNLKPRDYAAIITGLVVSHKTLSLTTDNGIENRAHKLITEALPDQPPVYFTDPYSSYQKGGVENANKMLRKYFPKGTNFATVTQTDVVYALTRINNKPRKILGYKSALQVAKEKGVLRVVS